MKLYTNCEKFHCSMERKEDTIPDEIGAHLTITRKAKYSKIHPGINICDICSFDRRACEVNRRKPAKIEDFSI